MHYVPFISKVSHRKTVQAQIFIKMREIGPYGTTMSEPKTPRCESKALEVRTAGICMLSAKFNPNQPAVRCGNCAKKKKNV